MNKRIRDLQIQAFVECKTFEGDKVKVITDEVFERFAELIVRECINIACEYDKPKLSGPGLAIASNIESHFNIYIEEDGRLVK